MKIEDEKNENLKRKSKAKRNDGWIKLIENIVANDTTQAHLFSAFQN